MSNLVRMFTDEEIWIAAHTLRDAQAFAKEEHDYSDGQLDELYELAPKEVDRLSFFVDDATEERESGREALNECTAGKREVPRTLAMVDM